MCTIIFRLETKYSDTELKIRDAAKSLFLKKGYSATTTRDIAQESQINLALLNYYFTSKRRLFEIIMFETLYDFLNKMVEVYNDEETTIREKIELASSKYIDMIIAEPLLPTFILNELKNNPTNFLKMPTAKVIMKSQLISQYNDGVKKGIYKKVDSIHFITNILSLIVFPFICSPIIMKMEKLNKTDFNKMMNQRKKLIPEWIIQMIKK
ncbi:MAG: TetR family transcriptional regulator [Cryomorphaceae bacterium MED-G11]|nr:TetR family transcriptional regulator [Flavobacteriaceae bacterium]PDH54276.1 MAG: TetR family transcriptional regulator [Cryomorphaceae bacterium MED-G11]